MMNNLQRPDSCIQCGAELHRKSEYFCSKACAEIYNRIEERSKIQFLSKKKLRKSKLERDQWTERRQKTRKKTKQLIKEGKIKQSNCNVCGSIETIPHHEDYGDPFDIVWLCEAHHKAYHKEQITILGGRRRWNNDKLINFKIHIPCKGKSSREKKVDIR
jgi:predicted nucleic acid-binding Zn ribbon protein